MPASPYFLLAQVSLVAVSAVAMKVGWSSQSPLKKSAKTTVSKPAATPSSNPGQVVSPTSTAIKAVPFSPNSNATDNLPVASSRLTTSSLPELTRVAVESPPVAVAEEVLEQPPELPLSDIANDMAAYRIEADSATNMDLGSQTVVFTGSVHLNSARFKLVADHLTVHMNSKEGTLRKLVAHGHVEVVLNSNKPEEAYQSTSNEAIFNPKDSSILLTGWPVIHGYGRDHRAATAATQMILYTDKPRLTTQGRASTRLTGKSAAEAAKTTDSESKKKG